MIREENTAGHCLDDTAEHDDRPIGPSDLCGPPKRQYSVLARHLSFGTCSLTTPGIRPQRKLNPFHLFLSLVLYSTVISEIHGEYLLLLLIRKNPCRTSRQEAQPAAESQPAVFFSPLFPHEALRKSSQPIYRWNYKWKILRLVNNLFFSHLSFGHQKIKMTVLVW